MGLNEKKKRNCTLRVLQRGEPEGTDWKRLTPAERLGMVWPLTVEAWTWACRGDFDAESRLPRHIVRVIRRGR